MDYRELVAAARSRIREITPEELEHARGSYVVVDIREADETATGVIDGARLLPRGVLERDIATVAGDRSTPLALVCAAGERSALAALALEALGYTAVVSVAGGFDRWRAEGRPWTGRGSDLTDAQRLRYERHLRLPEIGEKGQVRLAEAHVAVVGAGGLGSPALLYLAAAGVGTITVVDGDRVDITNLQRQVIHETVDTGRAKVESAKRRMLAVNPEIDVRGADERLTASNALDLLSGCDVIVDGSDNFPTRYLVNDAALNLRTPVVHGSVYRFEGQASVFVPYAGPCYRCLFPLPPPPELAPSCAEAGVLGALPGVIGAIQAAEAVKVLLGIGDPLVGRLLVHDALTAGWTELRITADPECPACSDPESPPPLVDYDAGCVAR